MLGRAGVGKLSKRNRKGVTQRILDYLLDKNATWDGEKKRRHAAGGGERLEMKSRELTSRKPYDKTGGWIKREKRAYAKNQQSRNLCVLEGN